MDRKIIPFPGTAKNTQGAPKAFYHPEHEVQELVSTIAKAAPPAPRHLY